MRELHEGVWAAVQILMLVVGGAIMASAGASVVVGMLSLTVKAWRMAFDKEVEKK
jgi:hypothetical protein